MKIHRYEIFLKTGEIVEVEAESVKMICDEYGNVFKYQFIKPDCQHKIEYAAEFYSDAISGWAELSESEDKE